MRGKRYLTNDELNIIRHEEDMLKGNINRMCVSDDSDELVEMYRFARLRIQKIFDICLDKFIDDKESDNNDKQS